MARDCNVYTHPAVIEHNAEECDCAHMWLDDQGVPRRDGDQTYSLVGRIVQYGLMHQQKGFQDALANRTELRLISQQETSRPRS